MILCETNSMEAVMSNKTITHEVKLQKSVIIILGIMAFGVCANVFAPALSVQPAMAELVGGETFNVFVTGSLGCNYGCN